MFASILRAAVTLTLAAGITAQSSTSYTDSNTGITFQSYSDSDTGYLFGLALPESPESDFIGQIVAEGSGWAGASIGGGMLDGLLVVTWPNDQELVGSLRAATAYQNPDEYTGDATLEPIADGTFVNSTHFSYTFLCKGCINDDSFSASATTQIMGWAYSATEVTTPSSTDSELNMHTGYGEYAMLLSNATSSEYSTWAAMASTSSGNSTSNSTATTTASAAASATSASNSTSSAPTATSTSSATYDVIVAGAGVAGIIVAERLAEAGQSVLLLERGGASTYSTGSNNTLSWNDTVTPVDSPVMAYNLLTADPSLYCSDTASTAGCVLGGSGSVNALMFVKPQEADFEKWPTGWNWEDVESSAAAFYKRNPGTDLPSSDGKYYDQSVFNTLSGLFGSNGWTEVDAIANPNAKTNVYAHPPWNILNAERAGPVKTYLPLAQALDNFKLALNTKVVRVVRTGSSVTGVEVETAAGAREIININDGGKVILASGTLSTPRILFNSGIGPSEQISIVQNGSTDVTLPDESDWIELPVGKGIKDHPIFPLTLKVASNMSVYDGLALADGTPDSNDVEMYAKGAGVLAQGGQRLNFWTNFNSSDGITRYIQGTTSSSDDGSITMKVYLTHGLTSSGVLGITASGSTAFTTKPWMTTEEDKAAMTSFFDDVLLKYINANSTLSLSTTSGNATGADLITNIVTGDHFVSSAKMGTDDGRNNGTSVVDTDTKVYGTDNLFIVDASIHPDLPTGNTQAIVAVVAEMAASKIAAFSSNSTTSSNSTASASASTAAATLSSSVVPTTVVTTTHATVTSMSTSANGDVVTVTATDIVYTTVTTETIDYVTVGAGGSIEETTATASVPTATSAATSTSAGTSVIATSAATSKTSSAATSAASGSSSIPKYGQCGGANWTGSGSCASGSTCHEYNTYYSQCI